MKPVPLKSQIYAAAFAFHAIHAKMCTYNFPNNDERSGLHEAKVPDYH